MLYLPSVVGISGAGNEKNIIDKILRNMNKVRTKKSKTVVVTLMLDLPSVVTSCAGNGKEHKIRLEETATKEINLKRQKSNQCYTNHL